MDPIRFDALARALSQVARPTVSRRLALPALAGLLASTAADSHEGVASKRRPKRVRNRAKRRKKARQDEVLCPTGQLLCNGQCAGCCSDADCGGNACNDGRCQDCPRGQRLCRGGCLAESSCCNDGECTGGQSCIAGACACRANERLCEGACIPNTECCGTDCPPAPTCSPENCNGCCDGATCRQGDSQNFCGRNGEPCQSCALLETCDAGQCLCERECCGDAGCNAGFNGLCRPEGTCAYPPDCFEAGRLLFDCVGGNSESCCSLHCDVTTDACVSGIAGEPCHSDDDCQASTCQFYVCTL